MSEPLASIQAESPTLVFEDSTKQSRFELGTSLAIYQWEPLQTAVDNQWGGPDSSDKRDWMVGSIVELFETSNYVDSDDIEDRLLAIMEDEFEVVVDDDSSLKVAVSIIQLYKECAEGDFIHIDEMYGKYQEKEARRKAGLEPVTKINPTGIEDGDDEDDDDDDEDDDEDEWIDEDNETQSDVSESQEKQGPILDDDGFELVQKKGNRRR
jgi:pre-rRNA-processing protein TSR2